jgi:hypothetical protein
VTAITTYAIEPPIEPMLAKLTEELPAGGNFLYEPKWDGFRAIVFRDGDDVDVRSRNDRPLNRYFPELLPALADALPDACVVDGEIVIATDGLLDFDALLRGYPITGEMCEKIYIIPPARTRYLSEIAENNRQYDKWVEEQKEVAQKLYSVQKSIEAIKGAGVEDQDRLIKELPVVCVPGGGSSLGSGRPRRPSMVRNLRTCTAGPSFAFPDHTQHTERFLPTTVLYGPPGRITAANVTSATLRSRPDVGSACARAPRGSVWRGVVIRSLGRARRAGRR